MHERTTRVKTKRETRDPRVLLILPPGVSPNVVRRAAAVAESLGATLEVLRALPVAGEPGASPTHEVEDDVVTRAWRVVEDTVATRERLARDLGATGREVTIVIRHGRLATAAARVARERGARLVIIPGVTPLRFLVAAEVAFRAGVAVLVTPSGAGRRLLSAVRLRLPHRAWSPSVFRQLARMRRARRTPREVLLVPWTGTLATARGLS